MHEHVCQEQEQERDQVGDSITTLVHPTRRTSNLQLHLRPLVQDRVHRRYSITGYVNTKNCPHVTQALWE